MTTLVLVRRFLADYGRQPVNLVLLVVVPVIFVALAAGTIADFAALTGGIDNSELLSAPTAGWAAAFLAGVAGFFLVLGSRDADHRLARAGLGPTRIAAARLGSGLILALLAGAGALIALAARTSITDPARAIGGTLMFAAIYLAIGAGIGAVVDNAVNGSLIVVFVWMLDVFLGPAMAGGDVVITRLFPSHFVTLVMVDSASGHSGPIGDLGWALAWTLGGLAFAGWLFFSATRGATPERRYRHGGLGRVGAGFKFGFREYRRNPAMWVLLVVLPAFFITLSFYITPDMPTPVQVVEGGQTSIQALSMIDVHGAIMVPITVAFLAGLAGLFVVQASLEADRRLAIAGFRSREILGARLAVIGLAALLSTGVSLLVTAVDFSPRQWGWFTLANVMVAATYGMIGVITGSLFGRVGGLYVMFLVPFVDVGIAQNVMFSSQPPTWGGFLPSHGAVSLMVDSAYTSSLDETGAIVLALAWLIALAGATGVIFHRISAPEAG
ncbi:MAG: ABC transporter permease [Acidimicrobiia bacterium]|nr:ABC transporter permease [Acidimicrobiia bacterium]NNF55600.1 ABC transporter permease [Acidimicrobiales bacterium]NNL98816.1 ABC transporter permease [Acidimicrobiia bacterium]